MEDHSKTIIHIDIDCFYAQVEINKNPSLKDQPLGIQQKNIVVTSNYIAREFGIKKCMSIVEAKKLCPNLVLVKGEDLYDYRHVSQKMFELLEEFTPLVEKLGMDENFLDISDLVNKKLNENFNNESVGHIFGSKSDVIQCECGCSERINIGSQIAQKIRMKILETLHLTTCAGIAHNKLLAKVVGTKNKPNKQTLIYPNAASELILSLGEVRNIPWIGQVTSDILKNINISSVEELQNSKVDDLRKVLDSGEKAINILNLSYGIDNTTVKRTGKPQSIGLEDACKPITAEIHIRAKFAELFKRLLVLIKEDGRIPKVLKIILRKYDPNHNLTGIRETRQCNIDISLNNEQLIIQTAMSLFSKAVDKKKPFKINLLGLSFSKLTEKPNQKNTLMGFFQKECRNKSTAEDEPLLKRPKLNSLTPVLDNSTSLKPKLDNDLIECPPGMDQSVFLELPADLQQELWNNYKANKSAKNIPTIQKKSKINTLFNYMSASTNKK